MARMNTREYDASASYKSINWNVVEDMVDK